MECLVCANAIRIHQFQQLFSCEQPIICSDCSSQMIECKGTTFPIRLYEDNLFMQQFVQRLRKGDLVLQEIIIKKFHHVISKFQTHIKMIIPVETNEQSVYPHVTILAERLKTEHAYKMTGPDSLMITDELSLMKCEENKMIISIL